jgi:zinc protease
MINSFIAEKDLRSEFSVVRNEFESGENNPGRVLLERVMSTAYLWHNYGKSTIGSREDIERVPIESLRAFYKNITNPITPCSPSPENSTKPRRSRGSGNSSVRSRDRRACSNRPTRSSPSQDGERHVTLRRVGDVQVTAAGYHIPSGNHPDYAAVEILSEVLTAEPSGRLYKALVETRKASGVGGIAFELRDPGYTYFAAEVLKDKPVAEATTAMLAVFDTLAKNPITDEEVQRAKNTILENFELTYANSERVGLGLSEYIAKGDLAFVAVVARSDREGHGGRREPRRRPIFQALESHHRALRTGNDSRSRRDSASAGTVGHAQRLQRQAGFETGGGVRPVAGQHRRALAQRNTAGRRSLHVPDQIDTR